MKVFLNTQTETRYTWNQEIGILQNDIG